MIPTIELTFVGMQMLSVGLESPYPQLQINFAQQTLQVDLAREAPLMELTLRTPQPIDAAVLPILIGPPGPAGGGAASTATPRTLTWTAGRLVGVSYADGRSKAMTWVGDQLTRVDTLRPSLSVLRADLSYNPDGTLAAVTHSEV